MENIILYGGRHFCASYEPQSADWNDPAYLPCMPCYPGLDELGNFQCTACLAMLNRKAVIFGLTDLYGSNWKEAYDNLKETKSLIRREMFERLSLIACTYFKDDGTIKTLRYFYEKKW